MNSGHRNPPETPEAAAGELFMGIRRAEEKEGQNRSRGNRRSRRAARGIRRVSRASGRRQFGDGATLH